MKNIKFIGKIHSGQDGAIYNGYLFRFEANGKCFVYDILNVSEDVEPKYTFTLDKSPNFAPHSNSVSFGVEFYETGDEFPLLYTNVYNNFAKSENDMRGCTFVYRIVKNGEKFTSKLIQIIKIGFTSDTLWKSSFNDVRPYGNFVIDVKNSKYYAFTMRDESETTNYFEFNLPKVSDGLLDKNLNVNVVTLNKSDILKSFTVEYHRYIQGATFYNGKVYSVEGFTNDIINPAVLRVVNVKKCKQELYYNFANNGYPIEPEFICFYNDICYYADNVGNLYTLEF